MHTPKRECHPLPLFANRSIRIKQLNRVQILPAWQTAQLALVAQEEAVSTPAEAGTGLPLPLVSDAGGAGSAGGAEVTAVPMRGAVLRIGALRVLELGRPQPGRAAFNNDQQVLPLGYTARRRYHDVIRASGRCKCHLSNIHRTTPIPDPNLGAGQVPQ